MDRMPESIPSLEKIWYWDKKWLMRNYSDIKLNWDSALPGESDVFRIYCAHDIAIRKRRSPISVTQGSIETPVDGIASEISRLWGAGWKKFPEIKVCDVEEYDRQIQKFDKEFKEIVGIGIVSESLYSGVVYFPTWNEIMVCKQSLHLVTWDNELNNNFLDGYPYSSIDWDKGLLEVMLTRNIAYSLFNDIRDEISARYIEKIIDNIEYMEKVGLNSCALGQITCEATLDKYPNRSLFAINTKLYNFWRNTPECKSRMNIYKVQRGLSRHKTLAEIAFMDDVLPKYMGGI